MLGFFRGFAKSWVASALMGLLMLTFLLLGGNSGLRDMLRFKVADAVVQAGSRVITSAQFQKRYQAANEAYEQRTSQTLTPDEAVKQGYDQDLVNDLASQTTYSEMLARSGVQPSDTVVASELTRAAQSGDSQFARLFNPMTGKFDPQALNQLLRATGQSADEFQQEIRDSIASQEFASAVGAGFHVPKIYAAVQAALLLEARDVTYFVVPLASVPMPTPPTDAQLATLLQQNREQLMLPPRRKLTIVRFSAKALAPSMTVDPAAVQQQFEAKKASYGRPEVRSLVEIPLNDPHEAPPVQARLAKGEDPTAVGKSIGVEAVSYADQPQSAVVDRKAGAAAFAMKAGEVSGPIQGDFKPVIVKVTKVTPGQAPSLEAARPQIEAELRQSQAIDKVYDLSQKFDDLRQGGASFQDAAAKVGATAISIGPVTADGKDIATGQPDPQVSPRLLKIAFDLAQGADSDVEQELPDKATGADNKGESFAVHVEQVIAASPPALTDPGVRPALAQLYMQQTVVAALQKKATAAQAEIQKGQSFEAAAAAAGGHVTHQLGVRRAAAQQYQQMLGQEFLAQMFGAKVGQIFLAGSDPLKGLVVARLDAVHPADPDQIASVLPAISQRADQSYLGGLASAIHAAAAKMIKPRIDLALARTAMGVDPTTIASLTAKPAVKGAGLAK
jgi:peptidyl-prolyl cis-trans isomerase D